jgi:hypothetical protein
MQSLMQRRCFVVAGSEWAQIFSLVGRGSGPDAEVPIWRRLHVLVDRHTGDTGSAAGQAAPEVHLARGPANEQAAPGSGGPCNGIPMNIDDEPTADSSEWTWGGFAGSIIHAAGIAVRNTGAREVVLVAPPRMLDLLRRRLGALLQLGVQPVEVPMDAALLVSGSGRGLAALGADAPPALAGLCMIG